MPGALNFAVARIFIAHMQESATSQEELARKVGMGQATVSRVLNGKTAMTVDQLEAFCRALRLSSSDVVAEATAR